jgi:putative transcriptional regulator
MKIQHHPDDSTLMSYASGALSEPLGAVIAAHVALCSHCQNELRLMERIGFACVRALPDEGLRQPTPVARLRAAEADVMERASRSDVVVADVAAPDVPAPLRRIVGDRFDAVAWKRLGPGVLHFPLPVSDAAGGDLRLLKVAAGRSMPEHGHGGTELTLVLTGAYVDRFGRFAAGDVADLDEDVEHRPVIEAGEDCICLVASERRVRFKGLISRLVQPLTGM